MAYDRLPRGAKSVIILANEVWDVQHVRKGPLTVRLLQPADSCLPDSFVDAEIVEGTVHYASRGNQMEQRLLGIGTQGDVISMRVSLVKWVQRREDLE